MKKNEMRIVSSPELVTRYTELATKRGAELESGSPRIANRAFKEEMVIERELIRRGPPDLGLLVPLLKSPNPWVRLDAAGAVLPFAPEEAEPVLERLSREPRMLGMAATMNLEQWRKDQLKPSWRR